MDLLQNVLPFAQIILSVLLVTLILLQRSEAGLGSAFGDSGGGMTYTRRGPEKILFRITIFVAILFTMASMVSFLIQS